MMGISNSWVIFLLLISSAVKGEETERNANEKEREWCWGDYEFGIVVGVAAAAAAPLVLSAAGFTAGGVAAGSLAASVQSAAYGATVGSGTLFAGLQSAGAAGISLGAKANIVYYVAGATTYIKSKVYPCQERPAYASGDKE